VSDIEQICFVIQYVFWKMDFWCFDFDFDYLHGISCVALLRSLLWRALMPCGAHMVRSHKRRAIVKAAMHHAEKTRVASEIHSRDWLSIATCPTITPQPPHVSISIR